MEVIMKRLFAFVILLSALSFQLSANGKFLVKGRVTDNNGEPVVGAVVFLQGSVNVAASTTEKGDYTISISESLKDKGVLEISCLGFVTAKETVKGRSVINVSLQEDRHNLDEVVVVGYGAMRRSDLTGSVASIKIEESEAAYGSSISHLLQGNATGIQVINNSAAPDAGVNITIRGMTSLSGNSQPLYVLDGVILNTGDDVEMLTVGDSDISDGGNPLLGLNPQDIASIEVLKDASATAIYGSEGANGVILITTKMAAREKPQISFSAGLDFTTRYKRYPTLTFDEYVEYLEANTFNSYSDNELRRIYSGYQSPENRGEMKVAPVDWQEYCLQNTLRQRYYFTISGKPNTMSYTFSLGYRHSPGVVRTTGVDQYTIRLNLEKSLLKNLKIGAKVNYAYIKTKGQAGASIGSASSSMMRSILKSRPIMKDMDEDEVDWDETEEEVKSTPDRWLKDSYNNRNQFRLTPNLYLQWKILPWLTYKVSAGGDFNMQEKIRWRGASINRSPQGANGSVTENISMNWNVDNLLMVNKEFRGGHNLSGTVGFSVNSRMSDNHSIVGYNMAQYFLQMEAINSVPNAMMWYSESKMNTISTFARAIYNYRDRYVLTGTVRVDGSSKFQGRNKFATFPSFAFAWRINKEKWFNAQNVSLLKLRAGWGMVGKSGTKAYQTYVTYGSSKYPTHDPDNDAGYSVAIIDNNLANSSLKWETTSQYNVGLDMGFWNGRLAMTLEAYYKHTYDLLNSKRVPYSSGYTDLYVNQGEILNKGLEFSFDAVPVKTKNFEWSINGNISLNRNTILDIGTDTQGDIIYMTTAPESASNAKFYFGSYIGGGRFLNGPANIFIQGQPIGLFYGYVTDGIIQQGQTGPGFKPGDTRGEGYIRYVDINKDGYIDEYDRTIIGDPNPDFVFGFGTSLTYKRLSVRASFNGSFGNDICNSNLNDLIDTGYSSVLNISREVLHNSWTPENPDAIYPQLGKYAANDDSGKLTNLNIEDGSFLRLAEVGVSYRFRFRKGFLHGMNLGLSAHNLFVVTKYTGWDPEVSSFGASSKRIGIDNGSYPNSRSFSFDVKFQF